MSRFQKLPGAYRPATLSIAGLALAAVAVVAIAAVPGRDAADPGPSAPPATGAPPAATPVATPRVTPTPIPTAQPSDPVTGPEDGGTDAIPLALELDTFDGHAVSIDVVDRTGSVTTAVSGRPGDGASVAANRLDVTSVDARTLRLNWIDYPIDNRLALFVDDAAGHLRLVLVQPEKDGPTDAIGFDRELLLTFDRPVDVSTVEAILQGGLDTGG